MHAVEHEEPLQENGAPCYGTAQPPQSRSHLSADRHGEASQAHDCYMTRVLILRCVNQWYTTASKPTTSIIIYLHQCCKAL